MPWLNYYDDEVDKFHPVFERAANQALDVEGLNDRFKWEHHLRTPGNRLVPDFVLCERDSGRWRLAIEIKRSKESVYSSRNQVQAKGYAESNLDLYHPGSPKYFSITNLEQILLFALNGSAPPRECRLKDGDIDVGLLLDSSEEEFIFNLTTKLRYIIIGIISDRRAIFDEVWPGILSDFIRYSDLVCGIPLLQEPVTPNWVLVRNYFCNPIEVDSARLFLLRCLLAEYIRGIMERFHHPEARHLLAIRNASPNRIGAIVANALARLRDIDFKLIFEAFSLEVYRNISTQEIRQHLANYISRITTSPSDIETLACNRLDRNELLDGLTRASNNDEELDERGKVTTDPELASLLAYMTISDPNALIFDPCSGDGVLLDSAYTRLQSLGMAHEDILSRLQGIEVDPLLVRLAFIRLVLREPALINRNTNPDIRQGDMFANFAKMNEADIILMNPPFKRYESQDRRPVPRDLKTYYGSVIASLSHGPTITSSGQQNFFTYYVEYAIHAAKEGCRLGIILDNKWYHNTYALPLRQLLLEKTEIEAIIEYPYTNLFSNWAITTSILLCRKTNNISENHNVKFIRCSLDLTQVDLNKASGYINGSVFDLANWTCNEKSQESLRDRRNLKNGWKIYFVTTLSFDFREGLPLLTNLFSFIRRGSLAKEEGGMSALAFPFSNRTFGCQRQPDPEANRRYQNRRGRKLTKEENQILQDLAREIPLPFRGYAINNPNELRSYELREDQLLKQPTIEPPSIRGLPIFWSNRRSEWSEEHQTALNELYAERAPSRFIEEFRRITRLTPDLMPEESLWIGLREPYAGELIIPRKSRAGHRVHINPYACVKGERQVRLSSNFISLSNCIAVDEAAKLDRLTSAKLIAAFLVSSFGQLQFEMNGYNREGCLSLEEHHLANIHVLDPRSISLIDRAEILEAFNRLPFPIRADILSSEQHERNALDAILARIICTSSSGWIEDDLLEEVHRLLDEYVLSRNP